MNNKYDVYQFLKDAGVFYVTTVDGDEPKCRPFSMVMKYEGHICFTTDNRKHIYHQIEKIRRWRSVHLRTDVGYAIRARQ